MTSSTLRRLALAALVLALVGAAVFYLGRRGDTPSAAAPPTAKSDASANPPRAAAPTAASASPRVPVNVGTAGNAAADIVDFRAALDEARGFRDPVLHSRELGRILRLWLARDPAAALTYVRSLPTGADRAQAVTLLIETTAEQDIGRALTLARELVTSREEAAIYSPLFARLAREDPAVAATRLAEVAAGPARENAVRALTDAWMRRDANAALAWAAQLASDDRPFAFESAAAVLANDDPLRAIELAQKNLAGPALDRTLTRALHRLTETDPPAAAAIVALLPAGDTQMLAAVEVARALATQNISGALAWIETLPAGRTRQVALTNVLTTWAARDATSAGNYVREMAPGSAQQAAAAEVAATLARANVPAAIDWAQSLPQNGARVDALTRIADAWAQRDPAAASRWVADQAAGGATVPPQALAYTLSYWVLKDAGAAQEFVRTLPTGLQTVAATATAPLLAQHDPTATLAWAQSLTAPQAREAAVVAAFERWLDNAPDAARAWLATANLPDETKAKLRKAP
jgi:hypothetical protein